MGASALERNGMKSLACLLFLFTLWTALADSSSSSSSSSSQPDETTVIVVVGAPGEKEYGANFEKWAALWEKASQAAGAREITIGLKPDPASTDRDRLQQLLLSESERPGGDLWLVLIGHGTFDGKEAKF